MTDLYIAARLAGVTHKTSSQRQRQRQRQRQLGYITVYILVYDQSLIQK